MPSQDPIGHGGTQSDHSLLLGYSVQGLGETDGNSVVIWYGHQDTLGNDPHCRVC